MKLMKHFLLSIFCMTLFFTSAQTTTLLEVQNKIGGANSKSFYYGFAKGDVIILHLNEQRGKDIKEITITRYGGEDVFSTKKVSNIIGQEIPIHQTGVYHFKFRNSALSSRNTFIKIERKAGPTGNSFNSNVVWRTITDTIHYTVQEKYLTKSDTFVIPVKNESVFLDKKGNSLNSIKTLDFVLPDRTWRWSYHIGTGNEGKLSFDLASTIIDFTQIDSIDKYQTYSPLTAATLGHPHQIQQLKGNNNVHFTFLNPRRLTQPAPGTPIHISPLKGIGTSTVGTDFNRYIRKEGFLKLVNLHPLDNIEVSIKIEAIVLDQEFATRTIPKIRLNTYKKPFTNNN